MTIRKSTDPGLSAAKRRELRGHEPQEAIADHEKTQKNFMKIGNVTRRASDPGGSGGADAFFQPQNFRTTHLSATSDLVAESEMH